MLPSERGATEQDDHLLNGHASDDHTESGQSSPPRGYLRRGLIARVVLLLSSVAIFLRLRGAPSLLALGRDHSLNADERHASQSEHHHQSSVSADKKLMLMQFNPHWECFKTEMNMNKCGKHVLPLVTRFLQDYDIDFAHIIEFASWYKPPDGWTMRCENGDGGEVGCMIWKSSRWAQIFPKLHCFFGYGRACNVMTFQKLSQPGEAVTIAGAHYPHFFTPDLRYRFQQTLHDAVARSRNVTSRVVLLADANARISEQSDEALLQDIGALDAGSHASSRSWLRNPWYQYRTCCYNIGYWRTYDRIAANFGDRPRLVKDEEYRRASKDYSEAPEFAHIGKPITWAKEAGAYHHPIIAELTYA